MVGKAGWSVVDQGLYSCAGFLLNVWLIRHLSSDDYGRFALAFAVFLILSGIHNSFVMEPISIFGSSVPDQQFGRYFASLLWIHFLVCAVVSIATIATVSVLPRYRLSSLITIVAALLPVILLYWFIRRLCYALMLPHYAALGSGVYLLTQIVLTILLSHLGRLSEATSFMVLAMSSLISSIAMLAILPVKLHLQADEENALTVKALIVRHVWLGKWVAMQTVFSYLVANLGMFLAGASVGVAAAGVLKAVSLVLAPLQQVIAALGGQLALPMLARDYGRGDLASVHHKTRYLTKVFTALSLAYLTLLVVLREPISSFVGEPSLVAHPWWIVLAGSTAVLSAFGGVMGLTLRATQKVAYYPLSTAVPAVVGLAITPWMTLTWGVSGVLMSQLVLALVVVALNAGLYWRWV